MAKASLLTAAEMAAYRPYSEVLRYIERDVPGLHDRRVLDWGCGRGRLVASLLGRNIDAYGVDIDAGTLDNGRPYLASLGHDADSRLRLMNQDLGTGFPDEYFDMVVSDNVLEHVANLDAALAEMARITRPGGWGFHLFPARFAPVEGHLYMPFVHWLPKNRIRHFAIRCCVAAGAEPRWPETASMSASEKAALYFRYSRDRTFYRPPATIIETCRRHGLSARLVGLDHPRIRQHRLLGPVAAAGGGIAQRLVAEFKTMELFVEKDPA